jgi:hypothetical protein
MRVSFLNLFWSKPPAKLFNIRNQLLAAENNPQLFSQILTDNIQTLLYYNQYDEARLLAHYLKVHNQFRQNDEAIDKAILFITDRAVPDAIKDFIEYYILVTLVLLLNNLTPAFAPRDDMPEEARTSFILFKILIGSPLISAFLMYKRENLLEKGSLEKKQATISSKFCEDFISKFTTKLEPLFEAGVATIGSEHVLFEFQVKATNENASDFHKLLVAQPTVAAQCIETAFGDHLVNVLPDSNDSAKIHIMVRFRSAERCKQLVSQINLPFFNLDNLGEAVKANVAPYYRPGQGGGPR